MATDVTTTISLTGTTWVLISTVKCMVQKPNQKGVYITYSAALPTDTDNSDRIETRDAQIYLAPLSGGIYARAFNKDTSIRVTAV